MTNNDKTTSPRRAAYLIEAIIRAGGTPNEVFKEVGLNPNDYVNPDRSLSVNHFAELCELSAKKLNDCFFGLHMGLLISEKNAGPMSRLLTSSPTVGEVFDNIERYTIIVESGLIAKHIIEDDLSILTATLTTQQNVKKRHANEALCAQIIQFLKKGVGNHITPKTVYFNHDKPLDITELENYFCAPIIFNHPTNKIVFEKSILHEEMATTNDTLYTVLKAHFEELLLEQPKPDNFVTNIRKVIKDNLSICEINEDYVASQLAISPRTLRRRLQEHNLTFNEIKKQGRQELAHQYLLKSQLCLSEIALLLGYSETSAFCRAFRDWTGTPPLVYRKQSTRQQP